MAKKSIVITFKPDDIDKLMSELDRLQYMELCISVLVAESSNMGLTTTETANYFVESMTDALVGGPYERGKE